MRAVLITFILDSLLCLLPLVSPLAFNAVTSITQVGLSIGYAIPIGLRLYTQFFKNQEVPIGSFSLGPFSRVLSILSFLWLTATTIILLFPAAYDPVNGITITNFNYTPIIVGLTLTLAAFQWYAGARKRYSGPPDNVDMDPDE